MGNHSNVVGGSSAARVMACPASVKLSQKVPPQKENDYTREGTALHGCMEAWLLDKYPSIMPNFIGAEIVGVKITEEHQVKLNEAALATLQAFKQFEVTEFEPEGQVHFQSAGLAGAFGTCDVFARNDAGDLILLDYKFGDGVLVDAKDNKQLMFYAAAALEDPEFKDWVTGDLDQKIILGIIQPAKEDVLDVWTVTAAELAVFSMELTIALAAAENHEPEPCPGDHCRWCPAAPTCPAKQGRATEALHMAQEDLDDLAAAMKLVEELEPWFKQVRDTVHRALENGDEVEGYKLVKKRATRSWIDPEDIGKKLNALRKLTKDDYFTQKLVSPAQLEKICKAKGVDFKQFASYYDSVSSGNTVAHEDDPREAVVVSGELEIAGHLAEKMKSGT